MLHIYISILISILIYGTKQQAKLFWGTPTNNQQSNIISLIVLGYMNTSTTTITYRTSFSQVPTIMLSLSTMSSIDNTLSITQQTLSSTTTQFIHKLTINDPNNRIQTLKISYNAISMSKFYYMSVYQMTIPLQIISTSNIIDTQFITISYLQPLIIGNNYTFGIVMTGFSIISNNTSVYLSIDSQYINQTDYSVKVQIIGGFVNYVQFTRFIIDKSQELLQNSGLGKLYLYNGVVTHYQDGTTIYSPYETRIKGFGVTTSFHGIKQFTYNFTSLQSYSFFIPHIPPQNLKVTIIIFIQQICPFNYVYIPQIQQCYLQNKPRIYQISLNIYGFCFQACYRCTGPTIAECTEYLHIQSSKSGQHISCLASYQTADISKHCRLCITIVDNCQTCLNDSSCTSCKSGCTLINSTYCDCTALCNKSYQMISPRDGTCICKPQYYRMQDGTCGRCARNCYLCSDTASNCMSCIQPYQLQYSSCVTFQHSTYFINQSPGIVESYSRCTQYIGTGTCVFLCPPEAYMFSGLCYLNECPSGTFPIIDIYINQGLCQYCPSPCIQCDNVFICKKCKAGQYFLSSPGICVGCVLGCQSCTDPYQCNNCSSGYHTTYTISIINGVPTNVSICQQLLPTVATSCNIGCDQCLIIQYCQKCSIGYYRYRNDQQCTQCIGDGLTNNTYGLVDEEIVLMCKEICGDGLLYFDQCDDGNVNDGDGCSHDCRIQNGYQCQYIDQIKQSVCIVPGQQMSCQFSKNLTQNQINITIKWLNSSTLHFSILCQNSMLPIITNIYTTNSTYTFNYTKTIQNITCIFYIPQSILTNPIYCNITTSPFSIYYQPATNNNNNTNIATIANSITTNTILYYCLFIFQYIATPLKYVVWIIGIIGIDPYDIIINHAFIYLYLTTLYKPDHQPSNVFSIFVQLKQFAFDFQNTDNSQLLSKDGDKFVKPCYYILIYIAIILITYQIILRIIIKLLTYCCNYKPKTLINIFQYRYIRYICIYTSLQPIIAIYITSIFNLKLIKQNIFQLSIASLHLLIMLLGNILLIIKCNKIIQIKSHIKLLFYIIIIKQFALLAPVAIYYDTDKLYISGVAIGNLLVIFIIYTLMDKSSQIIDNNIDNNGIMELESDDQIRYRRNCCNTNSVAKAKYIVRKINIIVQTSCFTAICILRIIYVSMNQSHNKQYNYQSLGIFITIIFICGNIILGYILNIISQIITLILYSKIQPQQQLSKQQQQQQQQKQQKQLQYQISMQKIREQVQLSQQQ